MECMILKNFGHKEKFREYQEAEIMIIYILAIIAFLIASYTDIKNRQIPLLVFPSLLVCDIIYILYTKEPWLNHIVGMLITFLPSLLLTFLGGLGGGDLIMLTVTGFIVGSYNIWYYIITVCVTGFFLLLLPKKITREIPIAPLMCIGYIIFVVLRLTVFTS